jgi:hypothetical protein
VRFEDPLNRAHLDRFPPKLLEAWREGRVITQGRMHLLPGFNDPQALFMLGEVDMFHCSFYVNCADDPRDFRMPIHV